MALKSIAFRTQRFDSEISIHSSPQSLVSFAQFQFPCDKLTNVLKVDAHDKKTKKQQSSLV